MAKLKINKSWTVFILAIVLGLAAMFMAKSYLARQEKAFMEAAQAQTQGATIVVVVPNQNMVRGDLIEADRMATRPVPAEFTSPEAIKPEEIDQFVGQKLAWPIKRGAPLLRSHIDPSSKAFATQLKPGKRALTIQVDDVNSTSGMVVPGNYIDLLLVREGANGEVVQPLFQNLLVMATGQLVQGSESPMSSSQEPKSYSTLTLELSPDQSSRLILAQKLGSIRAVLRGQGDQELVSQGAIGVSDLMSSGKRAVKTEAKAPSVEFIIGGNSEKGVNQSVMAAIQAASRGMPTLPAGGAVIDPMTAAAAITAAQRSTQVPAAANAAVPVPR
jgi:pilus assembly protein CpaB